MPDGKTGSSSLHVSVHDVKARQVRSARKCRRINLNEKPAVAVNLTHVGQMRLG